MNYWLFICTNQGKGASRITSRQIWDRRKADGYWGLGTTTRNRGSIKSGDRIIFYVGSINEYVLVASGKAKTAAYSSKTLTADERKRRKIGLQPVSDYFVDIDDVRVFSDEPYAISLIGVLDLFEGSDTTTWGSKLQGGVRELSYADYARLVAIGTGQGVQLGINVDEEAGRAYSEGNKKMLRHLARERNPKLRRLKLAQVSVADPMLCEVCNFDFQATFGPKFRHCVEIHHRLPLSALQSEVMTKLSDLAILCPNCHRAIHRTGKNIMSVEDFKRLRQKGK